MRAGLVVDALQMPISRRRPAPGLIHHSDQGSQYVSLAFGRAARDAGIARSMGSKGDCFDNAVAESFFAMLKEGPVHRRLWPTRCELRSEVFEYLEASTTERAGTPRSATSHPPTTRTELSSPTGPVSPLRSSHPHTRKSGRTCPKAHRVRRNGGSPRRTVSCARIRGGLARTLTATAKGDAYPTCRASRADPLRD